MELLKLLSANEIVAQIISFLILLFLMRIFAWKKILGLMDSRKERIASEFKQIEGAKADIARLKAEYDSRLNTVDEKARAIVRQAADEAKQLKEEIEKEGHLKALEIIETARENVKHELAIAKETLKVEIIDLTIAATENIIQEKLTGEDDKKLIGDFLEKMKDAK